MFSWLETAAMSLIPAFLLLDLLHGARRFARTRWWRLRGLLVTAAIFGLSMATALGWGRLFDGRTLLDLSGLGAIGGAAVGILVYEFLHYWYHRALHRHATLWRSIGHQLHHSAESLDAFGAYFLHPFDAFFFTTWSSLVFFPLLGVSVEAGILGAFFLTFNALFQHANLRTPRWIGWIIQRPEMHGVHHARGVHQYNYSDLPLWDMIFGTYCNPPEWEDACGFYDGGSARLVPMLLGRDIMPDGVSPAGNLCAPSPCMLKRMETEGQLTTQA